MVRLVGEGHDVVLNWSQSNAVEIPDDVGAVECGDIDCNKGSLDHVRLVPVLAVVTVIAYHALVSGLTRLGV